MTRGPGNFSDDSLSYLEDIEKIFNLINLLIEFVQLLGLSVRISNASNMLSCGRHTLCHFEQFGSPPLVRK